MRTLPHCHVDIVQRYGSGEGTRADNPRPGHINHQGVGSVTLVLVGYRSLRGPLFHAEELLHTWAKLDQFALWTKSYTEVRLPNLTLAWWMCARSISISSMGTSLSSKPTELFSRTRTLPSLSYTIIPSS